MRVRADDGVWDQAPENLRGEREKSWVLKRTRENSEKNSWVETEGGGLEEEERWGEKMKRSGWDWRN